MATELCHPTSASLYPETFTLPSRTTERELNSGNHTIVVTAMPSASRHPHISSSSSKNTQEISNSAPQTAHPVKSVLHAPPPQPANRILSSFMPRMHRSSISLLSTLQTPSIVAAYISHLDWVDAYPLFITCKTMYCSLQDDNLRDAILARYVPGYAQALRDRHMGHQRVPISIHDLDLLSTSQRFPLHRYPMHGLRMLTSLYPTFEDDELSRKLIAFTQAHSRFVLLLQSLVHSSSKPIPPEPEEVKSRPRFAPVQTLRELTFPPPLAYTRLPLSDMSVGGADISMRSGHKHSRSQPTNGTKENVGVGRTPSHVSTLKSARGPRPSANSLSSMMANNQRQHWTPTFHKRRLSIFSNPSIAPPPPEEPRTLKIYGSSWRRGATTSSHHRYNSADEHGFAKPLQRPLRRFASANNSSDSSISDVPDNLWNGQSPLPSPSSPHDLHMATSRVRAPILWTFVPCTKLEDGDQNVVECERQLEEAGLWQHLSTGDIVCNLGYVPPTDDSSSEDVSPSSLNTLPSLHPKSFTANSRASNNPSSTAAQRKWLMFDGEGLVLYVSPDRIPLEQPLSLPSPLYYAHIMPPSANHIYTINNLPVCDDVPQFRLVYSTTKVPSPHSPEGYALVKKYAWTARVVRLRMGDEEDIGDGWFGEWILEYDGTEEGKQTLLDALNGRFIGRRCWEVVREKSGGGKLWLRLLP